MTLRAALLDALALLLPVECAGCAAPDRSLCDACSVQLEPQLARRSLADGTPVVTALRYETVVRRVILDFKQNGRTDVGRRLALPLRAAVEAAGPGEICWVPSSGTALRRRGYDPVLALLRRSRLPVSRVLASAASGTAQKLLGVEERSENRVGTMRATTRLDGRRFVVVDDVLTSGATLTEAVRAIREAGGEVDACAALAFTTKIF